MYTSKYHRVFESYKNIHKNEEAILFCTGPSLNDFEFNPTFDKCIKAGVNRIYNSDTISKTLDYYFFGSHYHIDHAHRNKIHALRHSNPHTQFFSSTFTAKFGDGRETGLGNITKNAALSLNSIPFEVGSPNSGPGIGWVKEIDKYPFYGGSIAFPAVQFLLHTGVKSIYLVGCDLGRHNQHFYDNPPTTTSTNDGPSTFYLSAWKKLPAFVKNNYPDCRIISVNPRGLDGIFEKFEI